MPNNENFVDEAQTVIESLKQLKDAKGKPVPVVTTSKLRNLLAMAADIYNEVRLSRDAELNDELKERIAYLRVRCVYEAGRDPAVKRFVEKSGVLKLLKDIKTKDDYIRFSRYMEALVAWRKYLCEKDD